MVSVRNGNLAEMPATAGEVRIGLADLVNGVDAVDHWQEAISLDRSNGFAKISDRAGVVTDHFQRFDNDRQQVQCGLRAA